MKFTSNLKPSISTKANLNSYAHRDFLIRSEHVNEPQSVDPSHTSLRHKDQF